MNTQTAMIVGAAALLALSATSSAADEAAKSPAAGRQCFWTRNADGFAAADNHTLNIRVGVRDVFQFEMFGPCQDIDWNQRIALISRSGSMICTGMDATVISHSQIGPQRCAVRSVRKLTPEEIAALPRRAKP
ncbi:DUF6491 family protein [Phenylobacterium sp.]|jgi:hypothetical protein|uniref:DUF6491 family protein n=1 Tax=Phenylobacterium sp. TaxID=1871053 RepID=UPI002F42C037